jgi:glycosyltransferase involved in cell wall biosynthesis
LGYQDSKEYLARLDVLIVPSVDGEGSSAVIKEGWASGVPVLASDLESNRELIRSGSNGVLFANKDPKGLISSLLGLVGDPDLAGRCVQGGAEAIVHFGPKGMARQYLDCYLDLTRGQTAWV